MPSTDITWFTHVHEQLNDDAKAILTEQLDDWVVDAAMTHASQADDAPETHTEAYDDHLARHETQAADINNQGHEAQIRYLLLAGYEGELRDFLNALR